MQVYAVQGNFDDAQTGVKKVFADAAVAAELEKRGIRLSSANSINWGRLVPQIVYYFYAYFRLAEQGAVAWGKPVDFCVPTGNFGDILAGYYAKQMGLPVGKLVCASNKNNVLTDFLTTGTYDARRTFYKTTSPSMDILISSNLERLLCHVSGSSEKVAGWMQELNTTGKYTVDAETLEKSERPSLQAMPMTPRGLLKSRLALMRITISVIRTPPWPSVWLRPCEPRHRWWCCPPPAPSSSRAMCWQPWGSRPRSAISLPWLR